MPVSTMGVGINQKTGALERYQPPSVVPEASGADIGPVPPANPRPGMMWWDGSAFSLWDGTAWQVVTGGGSLTLPLAVAQGGTGAATAAAALTALGALPLAGGTLTAMNAGGVGLTLDVSANAANGITLTSSAFNSVGLRVNATGTGTNLRGIYIDVTTVSVAAGIGVFNRGGSSTGIAVRNEAGTTGTSNGLSVTNAAGTGIALLVDNPSADGGSALEIRRSNAGASTASIRMRSGAAGVSPLGQEFGALAFTGSIQPGGLADGAVIAASAATAWAANTPGGTRLDFKITPPGSTTPANALTIEPDRRLSLWDGTQMVTMTFGPPDSGGTGFRQLVVPN